MNKYPLVSIITPSYNQGCFIEETILSVLRQDYPNIQYIVLDGGSTDSTVDILKKYQDKITWISEKDKGQAEAVNKGWRMAKGEILGWLNSDDTYLPGAIRRVVDYFEANSDIKAVHGAGYYINRDGRVFHSHCSDPHVNKSLSEACYICQPSTFICHEVINKIGLVDENLHYCLDYDFIIRVSKEYKIGYLNEYLATARHYKGTKSSDYQKMYAETILVQEKYFDKISFNYIFIYSRELLKSKTRWPESIINLLAIISSLFKFIQLNQKLPLMDFIFWLNTKRRLWKRRLTIQNKTTHLPSESQSKRLTGMIGRAT